MSSPRAETYFRLKCLSLALLLSAPCAGQTSGTTELPRRYDGTITIQFDPARPANIFVPSRTLGAGLDGHERGEVERMLSPSNVGQMLAAGFKPLSYRLRTELGVEAWHWNPRGVWSDAARRQGYWTSAAVDDAGINLSYGYRLPRRGSTIDQANNDGYSRLDDGDARTFWKSNPYLDEHFTGDDNARHAQWMVVDLGRSVPVNAIRIVWGEPYATSFEVDYNRGSAFAARYKIPPRRWERFERGSAQNARGGDALIRLSAQPVVARYVRVLMTASSKTAPAGAHEDIRDRLGYAVREIYVGRIDEAGRLRDFIRHARDNKRQSLVFVSSTDPWHRAADLDKRVEQPGFDLVKKSGLTNNLSMLAPVSILYGTPENAAAEVRYLESRGVAVERVEMGEEPEDQYVSPEDYGALYVQWADALHAVDPRLQLGGPCFVSIEEENKSEPDDMSEKEWLARFLDYLRTHGHSGDYNFFSFEWYPFDDVCAPTAPQLAEMPGNMTFALRELQRDVLPQGLPILMTEYGYSAFAGEPEVRIEGALMNADIAGLFLTLGGAQSYLYGYEPNELIRETPCGWGNNSLLLMDDAGRIKYRLATYHAARMLTKLWAQPADEPLEVYTASADILNGKRQELVTAYALRRPDGRWSLLLVNKDPRRAWTVRVRLSDARARGDSYLRGPADLYQFSAAQYRWHSDGERGHPLRSQPPAHFNLGGRQALGVRLPPLSLSVVQVSEQ
ncbi:MAG TPA: discoidin domain-containing protein [Pyrinomonadaceae bacterium]|nr:discoidin domain-containing protein [Pyrinomonadaceae bacterium]